MTRKNRLIFQPMEQLKTTPLGTVIIKSEKIDDKLDKIYKPGIYRQTEDFINGTTDRFCNLKSQVKNAKIYTKIAGYQDLR